MPILTTWTEHVEVSANDAESPTGPYLTFFVYGGGIAGAMSLFTLSREALDAAGPGRRAFYLSEYRAAISMLHLDRADLCEEEFFAAVKAGALCQS